jgi:hypothetical protein
LKYSAESEFSNLHRIFLLQIFIQPWVAVKVFSKRSKAQIVIKSGDIRVIGVMGDPYLTIALAVGIAAYLTYCRSTDPPTLKAGIDDQVIQLGHSSLGGKHKIFIDITSAPGGESPNAPRSVGDKNRINVPVQNALPDPICIIVQPVQSRRFGPNFEDCSGVFRTEWIQANGVIHIYNLH